MQNIGQKPAVKKMVITVLKTETKPIKTSTLIPKYQAAHPLTRTKFTEMLEKKKCIWLTTNH